MIMEYVNVGELNKLFKGYDHKLGQAIKQNKLPMVSYYYARLTALFDVAGRSKINKKLCPNWCAWNKFSRMMKQGEFLIITLVDLKQILTEACNEGLKQTDLSITENMSLFFQNNVVNKVIK